MIDSRSEGSVRVPIPLPFVDDGLWMHRPAPVGMGTVRGANGIGTKERSTSTPRNRLQRVGQAGSYGGKCDSPD
jgi:hypothetical protein